MPAVIPFAEGAMGISATAAATASATAMAAYEFGASFIGKMLFSVAISELAKSMAPHPTSPTTQAGINGQSAFSENAPEEFVVGTFPTPGWMPTPDRDHGTSGQVPNAYHTQVRELSGVPGCTLNRVAINGEWVTLGTDPGGTSYGAPVQGKYNGYAWIRFYDGSQTVADPMLVAKYGTAAERPYTSARVGHGICFAIATFRFNRDLFSSAPTVVYEVNGIPLYDPRLDTSVGGSGSQIWGNTSTYAPTSNPMVMAYNIARGITLPGGQVWGGEYGAADLPLDVWFAAMNACDATVTNADASTEPAYRAGYAITVDMHPADVLDALKTTCSAEFVDVGGTLKVRVGGPGLPVYSFTDDDVLSTVPEDYKPFQGLAHTYNAVSASYPDPATIYQSRTAPLRTDAAYQTADGGRLLTADLKLSACPYPNQVQRLQKALLLDNRRFRQHTLPLPMDASVLEPLDAVSWTSAENGYTSKVFEVTSVTEDQQTLVTTVGLRERDSGDYAWTAGTDQLATSAAPVLGAATIAAQALASFAVAPYTVQDASANPMAPGILVSWASPGIDDVRGILVETRLAGGGQVVNTMTVSPSTLAIVVSSGLAANTNYEVQATIIPFSGRATTPTGWVAVTTPVIRLNYVSLATQVALDIANASKVPAVSTLPADNTSYGNVVFLTSDAKIYRWNSTTSAWDKTVDGSDLGDGTVVFGKLAAGAVGANALAANIVDATKMNVTDLSAISANLGSITVDNAHILNAAVDTLKVAGNSITNIGVWGASSSNVAGTVQVLSASLSLAQAGTIVILTQVDFTPGGSSVNGWASGTFWSYVNGVQVNALGGLYDANGRQVNVMRLGAGSGNAGSNSITVNCNASVASTFGITVLAIGIMR